MKNWYLVSIKAPETRRFRRDRCGLVLQKEHRGSVLKLFFLQMESHTQ